MNTYKFCNVPKKSLAVRFVIHCVHNDEVQHMGITMGEKRADGESSLIRACNPV